MSPEESPDTNGNGDTKGASVIVNAIAVLRTFTADEPLLGVTEIANRVGLHKSTVSRILSTFEQEHLVERDPETRRFRLGLGLIAVAGPLLAELEERRVAYPVLRELTEQTGETSALMVWNGNESMCVEQIASHHQIKHTTPLGARYRDAMSASVQVFLSAEPAGAGPRPAPQRNHHLSGAGRCRPGQLPGQTRRRSPPGLGHQLRGIIHRRSRRGRARVRPPRRRRGRVLIPAPRFRVSRERLQSLGEACATAAHQVTTRLGGRPPGSPERGPR